MSNKKRTVYGKNLKWTSAMDHTLLLHKASNASYVDIAKAMTQVYGVPFTRDMISSRARTLRLRGTDLSKVAPAQPKKDPKLTPELESQLKQAAENLTLDEPQDEVIEQISELEQVPEDLKQKAEDMLQSEGFQQLVKTLNGLFPNAPLNIENTAPKPIEPLGDAKTDITIDVAGVQVKAANKDRELADMIRETNMSTIDLNKLADLLGYGGPTGVDRAIKRDQVKKKVNKTGALFEDASDDINAEFSTVPEKKTKLKEIWDKFNDGKSKKILALSDLHAPFINFKAVEQAFLEHADADILVLNGDVLDGHAMSDFDKTNDFDIDKEFEQVFKLLDVATTMFDHIIWNCGNHERTRFLRMVSRKFGNGMKRFVIKRLDPMEYVAEHYDNVTVMPHHWVQIGDVLFNHPNGYSSAMMSTAIKQEEILRANAEDLLPRPYFNCLVQGHTHDLGEYFVNDTKIIEQGCMCHKAMDYKYDNPSKRKWVTGYAVVHLDEVGHVLVNKSHAYRID